MVPASMGHGDGHSSHRWSARHFAKSGYGMCDRGLVLLKTWGFFCQFEALALIVVGSKGKVRSYDFFSSDIII